MLTGLLLCTLALGQSKTVDYATAAHVDDWLRHPVYGDPSFDGFRRMPGNPIYRGTSEFAWPVNGFLFLDPKSPNWYLYLGDYKLGYGGGKSRCVLLRSRDQGKSWQDLGPVVQGDPKSFDKDGHTPDASVVYDSGRYHMVYDWGEPDFMGEGGLAYAWADRPEGPWHRAPEPITRNSTLPKIDGKYRRTYAPTLFRRRHDWLVVAMMDSAPQSWALFAMTAKNPGGPYSEKKIVRQVEGGYFHPPLLEGYPGFAHDGWVYEPMTSVARNRNFVAIFRAPIEHAEDPRAWRLYRNGSLWHSEDVEWERAGLWGQTFSGQVAKDGRLLAMFTSRDRNDLGTVSMAERPWDKPFRPRGFVLSGNEGPSFTCPYRSYRAFDLHADLNVRGTARIVWGYEGVLGPDKPASDATLHPLVMTRYSGLELSATGWKVVDVDAEGHDRVLAQGAAGTSDWQVEVRRDSKSSIGIGLGGKIVWQGKTADREGPLGLWADSNTHVEVGRFAVEGEGRSAHLNYLYTEGLLGAGENDADWTVEHSPVYRFGIGAVHKGLGGRAKWNFYGTGVSLWSPAGPAFGRIRVIVDGGAAAIVDLRRSQLAASAIVCERRSLRFGPHCLIVQGIDDGMPIDGISVWGAPSSRAKEPG